MRIVHIIGYFQPELGYEEYYLALKQAQQGHDVTVITSDRIKKFSELNYNRVRKLGFTAINELKVCRLPCIIEVADFILVSGMERILAEIKPDVVHAHEAIQGTSVLPAFYKKRLRYKLVVDQHKYRFSSNIGKLEYLLFRKHVCDIAFSNADVIVAITEESKKFLVENHKKISNKIIVSTLGVDTDLFKYDSIVRHKMRASLGFNAENIILIYAGKINQSKRLELLLESFKQINDKYSVARLVILGSGNTIYINQLKKLVSNLRIAGKVKFLDFVDKSELYAYYSMADIGVWPDLPSITILEAMACRLAVVLPDSDTTNHLLLNNNGYMFRRGDAKSLAYVLEKIIGSDDERELMRLRSQKYVNNELSYDILSEKMVDLYIKLLS